MLNNYSIGHLDSKRLAHFSISKSLLMLFSGFLLFTAFSLIPSYAETISVDVAGNSYDVEYNATGVSVTGIDSDLDFISLILFVDVISSPSMLDITFDRSFFDVKTEEGDDDIFFVLTDGIETNFTETETTAQSRTLSIEIPSGTEELEIIGSVFGDPSSVLAVDISEPVVETPEPVVETPEPVVETPEPVVETPEPVVETPEPVVETPEPVVETPKTQCGPGTTLQDGVCVLDERCGPGTVLQDDTCVLEPITNTSKVSDTSVKGLGKELVLGFIAAFIIAGIIGIILALMSKASKSSN